MASLKEIKGRIASVRSTLKITSAMKLVASSKLRHAQEAIENMLPYERRLRAMLVHLLGNEGEDRQNSFDNALSAVREVRKVAIVAFSSNSALCGGFNANAIREVKAVIRGYLAAGLRSEDITVWSVGRKMADSMRRFGYPSPEDLTPLSAKPAYEGASALAQKLIGDFLSGEVDRVELIYNHFASTSSQPTVRETYLPLNVAEASAAGGVSGRGLAGGAASAGGGNSAADLGSVSGGASIGSAGRPDSAAVSAGGAAGTAPESGFSGVGRTISPEDYIVEPSREELLGELLPLSTRLKVFTTLLDTAAAEHAARTVAMQLATDNANDLLSELTLEYNKGRQQKITSEILDIVGGSVNN